MTLTLSVEKEVTEKMLPVLETPDPPKLTMPKGELLKKIRPPALLITTALFKPRLTVLPGGCQVIAPKLLMVSMSTVVESVLKYALPRLFHAPVPEMFAEGESNSNA